jgi:hypothetical protein
MLGTNFLLADLPFRVKLGSLGKVYLMAGAGTLIRRLASHAAKQHGWAAKSAHTFKGDELSLFSFFSSS